MLHSVDRIGQNPHTTAGAPDGHAVVTGELLLAGGTAALCALATRTLEHRDVT